MSELDVISRVLADRADTPFRPTNDQKRAKSQFWTTFSSGAISPPPQPDILIASQYAGDKRIREWFSVAGFPQWFWNQNEFSERLDYLSQIALDQLETLVTSAKTSDSARVAAIKMVLEASKKLGQSDKQEFADTKIGQMDQKQLEDFIQSRTKLLNVKRDDQFVNTGDKSLKLQE